MTGRTTSRGALALGVLALALCSAQEPVVVRLRDAVGDTVDLAERDSFHLFPSTTGFHEAVILALPGPEFFAEITRTGTGSAANIFLRITPYDLERIRALIDNYEHVAEQQRSDSTYARTLATFWQTIEDKPLRNMAGDPAPKEEIPPTPAEVKPPSEPATAEEVRPKSPDSLPASRPQAESAAVVVRLNDAVGDTIELAERHRFHLFPNTAGFRHAVILALRGTEFYARVTLASADTEKQVFYRIMPGDLQRIRFLVNNREYVNGQKQSDSTVVQSLAAFWQTIEAKPLKNITGEPATPQAQAHPLPPEAEVTTEPQAESAATVVRLNDVVGDTIDEAERSRFHLFPYTRGFRQAVFLALPGPKFLAEVTRTDDDSVRQVYYLILPGQLERIRALLGDRAYVPPRARAGVSRALTAFWWEVQKHPLKETATRIAGQDIETLPADTAAVGGPDLQPATFENRYNYMLHGATVGSIIGGLAGSQLGCGEVTACGLTVLGAYAGYQQGSRLDRNVRTSYPPRNEGPDRRICCAIGAIVPGVALGYATGWLVGSAASEGTSPWIPAVLSGLCVTVEVVTLGYRLGRSLDRSGWY
jgi:hypothetical protein